MDKTPRVVIIGAGFGGLFAAQALKNKSVDVLLIDRNNYHTFTPLLYQVATAGLEAEEVAYPVRGIFRKKVTFMLGEVTGIDTTAKIVAVRTNGTTRHEHYDYLIVAAGSVTNYFGNITAEQTAFELKTLDDAVTLRNHILREFERAAWSDDPEYRRTVTTLVVVGGGPTGLETAGALFELYEHVLSKEYANLSPRIVLIEAVDRLLTPFPEPLQKAAYEQLKSLGVEVIINNGVDEVTSESVRLKDGTVIPTHTLIWSAGVKAAPLGQMLNVPLKRGGRIAVKPTLEAEGMDSVYVIGDMAYLEDPAGQPYPQLIPVAEQQGTLAASNILRRITGWNQQEFKYFDRGIMATIGRSRAVAYLFNRIQLSGHLAWWSWLGLHLLTLMGFRNRLAVFIDWVWNYFTYDRSIRLILESPRDKSEESLPNRAENQYNIPQNTSK
ncbi:MAG TPA: NAD(P)/FAD-dependent oxidoreductase [Phototrophicaceae bacterium]|nr:NAD(P)/FAD-dependent oxidoreductase [Phototrophicaceae bacterium]